MKLPQEECFHKVIKFEIVLLMIKELFMLQHISVERFKSLVKLDLNLGMMNVFIGANGSGKSNLLEAIGVLGSAAFGRVDDETLLRRGVRPGVPRLYKSAFKLSQKQNITHISFGAKSEAGAEYNVTLWNPLQNPNPAWRFKTETLRRSTDDGCRRRSKNCSKRLKENQT
jgi:predicted ATPase